MPNLTAKLAKGHWWNYTFHHDARDPANSYIDLLVEAIEYNESTYQVHDVLPKKIRETIDPEKGSRRDKFLFVLDIQSKIDEVYKLNGIELLAQSSYWYPDVAVSVVGSWQSFGLRRNWILQHQSYDFGLRAISQHEINFGLHFSIPGSHHGWSVPYSALRELVEKNEEHTMTAHFGDEGASGDPNSYLVHTLKANDRLHFLGGKTLPDLGVHIEVAKTDLEINIPPGFNLSSITFDPKVGHGGG